LGAGAGTVDAAAQQLAEEAAEQCLVLLENRNSTLPLAEDTDLAVIGPNGNSTLELLGSYVDVGTVCPHDSSASCYPSIFQVDERMVSLDSAMTVAVLLGFPLVGHIICCSLLDLLDIHPCVVQAIRAIVPSAVYTPGSEIESITSEQLAAAVQLAQTKSTASGNGEAKGGGSRSQPPSAVGREGCLYSPLL
jgi:hypothetical protein